ncbi:MAG: DedA family protein [Fulvimarina manganoxydans]|uniref:DedA family protein n=1 Tax=Fulvimarina manganoxydans TaxID=937218 RepID=UPI002355757A|nr:DedA family protein [Fulvimarina manganoxydans]MCK5931188.1 DedA family protein [Fulvimarina manganoxydans]
MTLEQLLSDYGLWAVLIGSGLEGETVVILGGLMVHHGLLALLPCIGVAALGSFIADQALFALGRRFRNHDFVRRIQARDAFASALTAFEKRPTLFVFGFRFLYGLRTVSPIAIGTTRLPFARFLTINAISALVWASIFVTLGMVFGHAIEAAFGRLKQVEDVLLVGVAVLLVGSGIVVLVRKWLTSRA